MDEDYDFKSPPELEFKRLDGKTMRIYRHNTDSHKFKALLDGKPWNPNELYKKATKTLKNKK